MNRIQITRQDARIEITSRFAQIRIQSPPPEMRVVRGSRARMTVQRTAPRLRVNWDKVRTAPYMQRLEIRSQASRDYIIDIASSNPYVRDGEYGQGVREGYVLANRMYRTRSRTDILRHTARMQPAPQQARMALMTSALEWELGQINIDWELERMEMDWNISRPLIEVEPYSVEIRMKNYPKILITYNPERVARQVGRKVDQRI